MRITNSRAAKFTAAVAAAGLLTVGCSSDDVPSVGEMTDGAKSAAESGMSKAESAKNKGESELNDASASGSAAGEDGTGESTQVNSPSGEAVTIEGATLAKYNESGGAEGKLGAPLGAPEPGPDGGTCQEFEKGLICDGGSTDAQIVWGEVRKAWEGQGGQNGELGYPTADEELNDGTYSQEFENGSISWSGGEPEITKN